ncbi:MULTISPECIES: Asp-tRNA(Asn)/Glu-tRNA(Gln) amidotransferase subunit GatC [Candidatus Nitrosocaldus]|jgi:aspartyl-tRNA(Asn)/glutamyl-tRNA(Gln) amidotransferase subunit C|uniref:Aspartyl/glutamyl-tRNA(Asn/Gln) amidotransferase subunit C n=1 Tax=Candidatus Nitrosocaldus cavascurensis TaxID=2058097 RepID=A0A2K5AQQ4_9ARCH|nr:MULTISPECIES: Asp-tRNA(Asn)/Glu-tRNA(Gln) amidotransferase subunit GatC [Candidatus Nitrosocaldus]SPC33929.1 Aspartyl/glutamyl-tRNA amidotransferase subunit C [Candidatus Nitrosocaldus cavascurensis]
MVSVEEVKHLAYLARIGVKDEELRLYAEQINEIIEYFNMLDELDISSDVEPYKISRDYKEMRDDVALVFLGDVLSNAKNVKDRFIKAPKMG